MFDLPKSNDLGRFSATNFTSFFFLTNFDFEKEEKRQKKGKKNKRRKKKKKTQKKKHEKMRNKTKTQEKIPLVSIRAASEDLPASRDEFTKTGLPGRISQ